MILARVFKEMSEEQIARGFAVVFVFVITMFLAEQGVSRLEPRSVAIFGGLLSTTVGFGLWFVYRQSKPIAVLLGIWFTASIICVALEMGSEAANARVLKGWDPIGACIAPIIHKNAAHLLQNIAAGIMPLCYLLVAHRLKVLPFILLATSAIVMGWMVVATFDPQTKYQGSSVITSAFTMGAFGVCLMKGWRRSAFWTGCLLAAAAITVVESHPKYVGSGVGWLGHAGGAMGGAIWSIFYVIFYRKPIDNAQANAVTSNGANQNAVAVI